MWSISIRNGDSLTKALKGWVPEDELSILAAGEISGNLSDSISNIIYIYVTKKKSEPHSLVSFTLLYCYLVLVFFYIFLELRLYQPLNRFCHLQNGKGLDV